MKTIDCPVPVYPPYSLARVFESTDPKNAAVTTISEAGKIETVPKGGKAAAWVVAWGKQQEWLERCK